MTLLFGRRALMAATLALAPAASVAVWAAGKDQAAAKDKVAATATPATATAPAATIAVKADTVHISIQTVPPRKAQVKWGGKNLGLIPAPRALVIERPRDSGPLDLVIRAAGFLPVHTRAYTFSDSRVAVKLTPPTEKNKLFGYKQEPTPTPDGAPPPNPTAAAAPLPPQPPPQP
jgi:hypothetical protein